MSPPPTIAISGCGAVVDEYYGPVLRRRAQQGVLRVVAVHDAASERMMAMTKRHFPDARCFDVYEDMLRASADLVILASPPARHAEQAVAALSAGAAVLCEKPIALSVRDADRMLAAAEKAGRLLAVGMVRRHFAASRIARRVIREGLFGQTLSVDVFEGGPFRWPIGSQSYFTSAVSGGGVLADIGSHVLDLLQDWLGELELVHAQDDQMGGVESNALLALRCGAIPVSVRLSRDWARPSGITVRLQRGVMRWENEEPGHVTVQMQDGAALRISEPHASGFLDCFGAQIDSVLDRAKGGNAAVVSGAEALATVALIEQAYAVRERMTMPWLGNAA